MFRIALAVLAAIGLAFGQGPDRGVARPPAAELAAAAGAYYALIIGVNEYPALPKLQTAVLDARSMETELRDGYRFRTKLLVDGEATRAGILRALNEYRGALHENDNLLIYYAGHGYRDAAADSAYWMPVDSDSTNTNWISADDIARAVRAMPARHVLLISDSCYSGGLAGTRMPTIAVNATDHSAYLQKTMGSKSRTFIASGGDEPVADGGGNGHSVFTGAVLRGLRALDGNAFSAENLFDWYVREPVGGGSKQTPHFAWMGNSGHVDGDFVFVSGVVEEAKAATSAELTLQVELAFWNGTDKNDAESLRMYLKKYPAGQFAGLAERSLERLAPAAPRPAGQTKVNARDGLRYVWIPGGTFQMGCSPGDNECEDNEKPAHTAAISRGFWIGQTPVTVEAWRRYRAAGGPALPQGDSLGRKLNEAIGNGAVPAVGMTWNEAGGYCEWAGGMRLPTEAEWELAARAGTSKPRYGNLDEIAWYGDNSGQKRIDSLALWNSDGGSYAKRLFDNSNGPKPVGQKQSNGYGLYDILGNVWQWTMDWFDEKYYQRREALDPNGPPRGALRAVRGGSWKDVPPNERVSDRGRAVPEGRAGFIGLRCVGD